MKDTGVAANLDRVEMLENRLAAAEGEMARMRRRLGAIWTCALIGAVGTFVLGANPQAQAQFGVTLSSLNSRLTAVEARTAPLSVTGNTFTITGKNVQIVDGTGRTDSVSGLGNLTVGYNELRPRGTNTRTGSHNLIVGSGNNYSSYGGLVAGQVNTISGVFASVSGGQVNIASGAAASVSGGIFNEAGGTDASVSGGQVNMASGAAASISGGANNTATGQYASVSGGQFNDAGTLASSVSGGLDRDIVPFSLPGLPNVNDYDWKAGRLSETQ